MTEEIIKCVKGESCIHCGSTYCRFVDEVNELKQENKDLKDNNNQLQAIIDDGRAENKRFREENKELKELNKKICEDWEKEIKVYWNALEDIRILATKNVSIENFVKIQKKINEVLNLS